ncbi:MAG: prepilin-type N-terminal cleavage/methylation domain-containing protein [Patescibacteria group bacterium]
MQRRGFTVVEIIITIAIMGILLTLAVVNLSSSQISARDSERKTEVESIAIHLESYYSSDFEDGNVSGVDAPKMTGGTYPGTAYLSSPTFEKILPELSKNAVRAPGVSESSAKSFVVASNNIQTTAGIVPKPSSTNDVYVYQPITGAGALCSDPITIQPDSCRKFNIYYYQESDGSTQMVMSKHQ